jgi:hypothetical protein
MCMHKLLEHVMFFCLVHADVGLLVYYSILVVMGGDVTVLGSSCGSKLVPCALLSAPVLV